MITLNQIRSKKKRHNKIKVDCNNGSTIITMFTNIKQNKHLTDGII